MDGSVARHRGEVRRSGAFMDSVLDRVSDMILFGCLYWYLAGQGEELAATLALITLVVSLAVSHVRAEAEAAKVVLTEGHVPAARAGDRARRRPPRARHDAAGPHRARGARDRDRAAAVVPGGAGRLMEFVRVATLAEVPEGEVRAFDLPAGRVAVAHDERRLFAFAETCPGEACALAEGVVRRSVGPAHL